MSGKTKPGRGLEAGRRPGRLAALGLAALATGCVGATVGSGVGDARLDRPPWVAGHSVDGTLRIAHLPIGLQRGAAQPAIFDPPNDENSALSALLRALDASLSDRAAALGPRVHAPAGTAPDVQFGCEMDLVDECAPLDPEVLSGARRPEMRLAVGRPSRAWTEGAAAALDSAGADALLLLTLEIGHYWPRQTSWRGSKTVELGSKHAVDLPWLTSLEAPISVLQLTGALVGRDGRALRIGAEGLLARPTGIVPSGFGAQALVTDGEIRELMEARRDDLPGSPLVWEAALRALIDQLIGA